MVSLQYIEDCMLVVFCKTQLYFRELNKEHKNENYGKFESTDDNRAGSTQKHPKSIISFQKPHPSIAQHRTEKSIESLS